MPISRPHIHFHSRYNKWVEFDNESGSWIALDISPEATEADVKAYLQGKYPQAQIHRY